MFFANYVIILFDSLGSFYNKIFRDDGVLSADWIDLRDQVRLKTISICDYRPIILIIYWIRGRLTV